MPTNAEKFYPCGLTAGRRYDVILRPSVGDPDLYTRNTSPVSQSLYDCRPYLGGTTEEVCTFVPTFTGTHYFMVHVYWGPQTVSSG